MARGPVENALEAAFRTYGQALRAGASLIPGDRANDALDSAARVLRRALDIPGAEEITPAEPPPAVPTPADPQADLAATAVTAETEAVPPAGEETGTERAAGDASGPATLAKRFPTVGPPIARPGETGNKGIFASFELEIDAPIERCFEVAADVVAAPDWTPALITAEAVPTGDGSAPVVFDTVGDAKVRKLEQRLRFVFTPPVGMRWEKTEGEPKSLFGAWEFKDLGSGRTLARYLVEIDMGRALSFVIRGPVLERVQDMLTRGSVEGLKAAVE